MEEKNKEIDLLELIRKLWANKKFIIKVTIIGVIVGLVIGFSIPKEYMAHVSLVTESARPINGNVGTLASLAGINIAASSDGSEILSPELYPVVMNSTPFVKELLKINIVDDEQKINMSLSNYLTNKQKTAWWNHIIGLPNFLINKLFDTKKEGGEEIIENSKYLIPKEEMIIIESLRDRYIVSTDKLGVTTISVTMQSAEISAFLADTLTSFLQEYIIKQRTKKATESLKNSFHLYEQAKKNYFVSQEKLATFIDQNKNVTSEKFKLTQIRLDNEATIAYDVYNQMAQQVERDKIKIQDSTPIFVVLQPSIRPVTTSKPSKKIIIIGVMIIFGIGGCFWSIKEDLYKILINNL